MTSSAIDLACASLLILACACTDNDDNKVQDAEVRRCFVGDMTAAPEIHPVYLDENNTIHDLEDGAMLPLILPPQGGKVGFVGVRAKNVDGCPLQLSTSLRDICDNFIIGSESRPVILKEQLGELVPEPPADFELGIATFSNLPICPSAGIIRDTRDEPYQLSIRIEDKDGRKASAMLRVTPYCAQPAFMTQCLCECEAEKTPAGECDVTADSGVPQGQCPPDAGM